MTRAACLLSLLTLALFSFAGARSVVMQATMSGPVMSGPVMSGPVMPGLAMSGPAMSLPMCGNLAGAHASPAKGGVHQTAAACAFCAAAAHAPVCSDANLLRSAVSVAWILYTPASNLGPRGPPDVAAKARGPPPALLTA
jgi:hypothetical protein